MESSTFPTLSEDLEWEMAMGVAETSKRGQVVSVSVYIHMYVCVQVKRVKVFGENVRKAAGEVDTSLKAADEGFREVEDRREEGVLGAEPFSPVC